MRFLSIVIVAAAGLFAGHVRGQFDDGLGLTNGLAPRSWPLAVAKPPLLGKRDGSCASGSHPCSDVNSTSCCSNTQYCIINTSWQVQCCDIGSICGNPCDAEHYLANETITTTITSSASASASTSASVTAFTTTTIETVCSGRACSSSFYGCPSSLGGGCCGFGQNCATDTSGSGVCIGPSSATSSTTAASTSNATSSALPTGAVVEHKSAGLSTGAKAGIAVAVIVLAALVIGAVTYLCLRRRRNGARSETTAQELPSMMPAGRGGAATATATATSANRAQQMSEADGDAVSYGYAPSSTGLSRSGNAPPGQGDYFGEVLAGVGGSHGAQQEYQRQGSRDQPRYQAEHPHDPDSVVAPVEIGTRASLRGRPGAGAGAGTGAHMRMDSQGSDDYDGSQSELAHTSSRGPSPAFGGPGGPASPVESIAGRFELYGDFGHAASGQEVFHDAQESVGGRGMVGGGNGTHLPQPFPTPGSEMSEFATPSPMSREEEAQIRREV